MRVGNDEICLDAQRAAHHRLIGREIPFSGNTHLDAVAPQTIGHGLQSNNGGSLQVLFQSGYTAIAETTQIGIHRCIQAMVEFQPCTARPCNLSGLMHRGQRFRIERPDSNKNVANGWHRILRSLS